MDHDSGPRGVQAQARGSARLRSGGTRPATGRGRRPRPARMGVWARRDGRSTAGTHLPGTSGSWWQYTPAPHNAQRHVAPPPFRWPSGDGTMSQQRARQGRTGTTLNDDGQQLVHITRSPHGGAIIMRNDKGRALVELELALSALPSASFVRWQRCGRPIRSSHAQFLAYFLAILLQQEVANGYQL